MAAPSRSTVRCPQCSAPYASRGARQEEILGKGFFDILDLQDIWPEQREDVLRRSGFCSDECADAYQVQGSLRGRDPDR